MIVPRVFKSRQRKRKNISIVLSSQETTVILVELRCFLLLIVDRLPYTIMTLQIEI